MGLDQFKKQEALKPYFDSAYGFVEFGTIAKGGFGIGAAYGNGNVFKNNKDGTEALLGESNMIQASLGFQIGAQVYSEIIFFETEKDFENFSAGNFEFGADANAVALTASASAKVSTVGNQGVQAAIIPQDISVDNMKAQDGTCHYTKGMAVFTVVQGGLMYEASISGQKFTYKSA